MDITLIILVLLVVAALVIYSIAQRGRQAAKDESLQPTPEMFDAERERRFQEEEEAEARWREEGRRP